MISAVEGQIVAGVTYATLAIGALYARPSLAAGRAPPRSGPPAGARSRSAEALWLVALAVVFAYPAAVLLFPSKVLGGPGSLTFPGDSVVSLAGLALIVLGGGLLGWSLRSLGRFLTSRLELAADQEIVRGGPYAYVRHPIYTANMLLSMGIALAFLSGLLWLPAGIIVVLAALRARTEERLFLASPRLGPEYAEYRAGTGRFLPVRASNRTEEP
jgi:protein-S-isoprenylcysteine O-methyltransferase Ste14